MMSVKQKLDQIDPIDRAYQIFSAKLVLEVFGGGGAIWGFSEVMTFRNHDNVWFWRPFAFAIGCIFFARFILQIIDHITELIKGPQEEEKSYKRLFQIFSARLVLEVFGAGGAIWGSTEALTLRDSETQEFWRKQALIVAAIFICRFCLQVQDYLREMRTDITISSNDDKTWMRLLQEFSARFVLQVLGGGGAIWGFSEVLTLRNEATVFFWRPCALVIGAIFLWRWILQIIDFASEIKGTIGSKESLRLLQVFGAKIVLEVFGGGGAIWGFSEVATLRNSENAWFWRPCAAFFGAVFFVRFCIQIKDFINEFKGQTSATKASWSRLFQIFSAKLVLEVFGGGAIWGFSEALTLRNHETQEFWRNKAIVVAIIFVIRYFIQMKDYTSEIYNDHMGISGGVSKPTGMKWIRLFQIFSATLVLQVFGAAGAIWGFSEVLTLRTTETVYFWRPVALTVGLIFFVRWMMQIKDHINECMGGSSYLQISSWSKLFKMFSAKLVLEVFGGGGAIWGFSEVLTLRNAHTVWFWRPCAASFGAIFFCRWVLQMKDYMEQIEKEESKNKQEQQPIQTMSVPRHAVSNCSEFSTSTGLDIPVQDGDVSLESETTPLFKADNGYTA